MSGKVVQAGIVMCNACGKPISVTGIKVETMRQGDLEVSFFRCPHCGRRYNTNTTDREQRDLMRQYKALIQWLSRAQAVGKGFRRDEFERRARKSRRLMEKMRQRQKELTPLGDAILNGEKEGAE